MKITIITVCFNSQMTIKDTLASVDSQTYRNIEHLIIDGGSTDQTLDILAANSRAWRLVFSEKDDGIYDAMNKGLSLSTGDVVGFLNSDDMFEEPCSLAEIVKCFAVSNPDAVYGDIVMVDRMRPNIIRRYWRPGAFKSGECANGWMAPHPTFYVRSSVLKNSGGFNLDYNLQADFDLELRLLECMKIRTVYIPRTLVRMRMGGATTGSFCNILRGNIQAAKSVRSHGFPGGIRFIASKILRRVPQFWTRPK